MKIAFIWVLIIFSVVSFSSFELYSSDFKTKTIHIADDGAEWPPYLYYKRINGKKTTTIAGFSLDIITEIFNAHGIKFTIELLPWKRTLKNVKIGKTHQMLLNASYSQERNDNYLLTRSYYTLNNVAFYSAKKYPDGLIVKSIEDVRRNFKSCGLRGYSYRSVGFAEGEVDQRMTNYDQLIKVMHLRHRRCDLFFEGLEIFAGFKAIGEDYLADEFLRYSLIPGMNPKPYYMMISKSINYAKALKDLVDEGITLLEETGRLDALRKKYNLNMLPSSNMNE